MMTVLLVDYNFAATYRLIIKDDKKEELYVWKRMNNNNLFHKKLSKKLVNKLILENSKYDLRYVSDEGIISATGKIIWRYESSY